MDKKEKVRRPLPTPGPPVQRPNTPVQPSTPVPPKTFYGTSTQKTAISSSQSHPGSSHTSYVQFNDPPSYAAVSQSAPDIMSIAEEPADDGRPNLITADDTHTYVNSWPNPNWATDISRMTDETLWTNYGAPASAWTNYGPPASAWTNTGNSSLGLETLDYMSPAKTSDVHIDGRSANEELNWWDPSVRQKFERPGPGMLPPVLAEDLHDPDHSVFSVTVTSPNIPFPSPAASQASISSETKSIVSVSSSRSDTNVHSSIPLPPQPSEEEVRTAVPHPNAYYCPRENGWIILSWKSSSVAPPLAQSFIESSHLPLPDLTRRKRRSSCLDEAEQSFNQPNKTHHFHKYEKAVDAHKLTPPYRRDEWDLESVKLKRRVQRVLDVEMQDLKRLDDGTEEQEEGRLLDLYVCCQCSFYCVASGIISGVLPRKHFEEFVRDKRENPPPGKTGEQAVVQAFETILIAIENILWRAENRMLRAARSSFQNKIGWNANIKRIFEILGFAEEMHENDIALKPPVADTSTLPGKKNRRKLLRAWVEISAWVVDYRRKHAAQLKDMKAHKMHVKIESAREMYQTAIGAHPDQIPRGELQGNLLSALQRQEKAWRELGLTPTSYSSDLLAFAYFAQCRCDPGGTVTYFTDISNLVKVMQDMGNSPSTLQELMAVERSRDRFTAEDIANAVAVLGFGVDGPLRVEYDEADVPDDFIEGAWRECIKRSWRDPVCGSSTQREATEALRILAESRGSSRLKKAWELGKNNVMTPERAYDTLEIPKDVDDNMLITVFNMRLEEQPMQMEKMREALLVIAEVRNSDRLRQFISSGQDPGEIAATTPPEMPRGLNQLGNTCYLNSLLQYFYTIKDLREAVLPMSKLDLSALEDEKLTDEDLKRHRVGGRLVTRREIQRSKRFIHQLAELFFNLEYCEAAAVTPTIELAKLALVTSRDEEDDEVDKSGTDSSNDTEATLVDDGPSRLTVTETSSYSPERAISSVLGKRSRDIIPLSGTDMDVDSPAPGSPRDQGSFITTSSTTSSVSPPPSIASSSKHTDHTHGTKSDGDGDVEMATPASRKPPPLPPRKHTVKSESVMMFGKQHDVAECMDNCMFQIETALLNFNDRSDIGTNGDKTSVVKRLFYGKLLQRLTGVMDQRDSRSSIHEKEDLFSHLPVNVTHDGVDIYDGLGAYFDDIVEYEGEKTRMEVSLVDVPPVLQIQLQRVQFNRDTLQPYKSQAYVKFDESIYLDRFMHDAKPEKKTRAKVVQAELNLCRERLRLLEEGKNAIPYWSTIDHAHLFLSKLDGTQLSGIDVKLLNQMENERDLLKSEIENLRGRAKALKEELENIWQDDTEVAYELTSVFVHRGSSPSWGHYFFYSRHLPDSPDSWFKYNDSDVTIVTKDEVLADTTGSTANPYLLVFARKGLQVVDTVKRFDPSNPE